MDGLADARAYISSVRWKFAKTMPRWPHEYTVRSWHDDTGRFDDMVQLIRMIGVLRYWPTAGPRREVNPQLDVDGWGYWTVGDPVGVCQVINRAELTENPHPGTIPPDEMAEAVRLNDLRGRRVWLVKPGPGMVRRPGRGQRPVTYREPKELLKVLPRGSQGTVMMGDTAGQIHVRWDDMSRSALRPGKDEWEWLT